jgi:hypothetical protein
MFREMLYAVIGFWFVALVNEKSHELTKKLSKRVLVSDIESSSNQVKLYVIASADFLSTLSVLASSALLSVNLLLLISSLLSLFQYKQ